MRARHHNSQRGNAFAHMNRKTFQPPQPRNQQPRPRPLPKPGNKR
ncbi:hypothetical protein ABT160_16355 [Streptomyces sp. NPDC001941]